MSSGLIMSLHIKLLYLIVVIGKCIPFNYYFFRIPFVNEMYERNKEKKPSELT